MSCNRLSEKIANVTATISGAVSSMSSKQAFLTGTTVGSAASGVVAVLVANRRKIAAKFQQQRSPAPLQPSPRPKPIPIPIPGSPTSTAPKPIPIPIPGSPTSAAIKPIPIPIPGSPTSTAPKPIPIPIPGSPTSATIKPIPIPGSSTSAAPNPIPILIPGSPTSAAPIPIPIPGSSTSATPTTNSKPKPIPIPLLQAPIENTHLQPVSSVTIKNEDGSNTTVNGYRVLRDNGSDTGLVLTPHLDENDTPQAGWVVTLNQTGKLIDGPFDNQAEAQTLASRLATITTWTQKRMPTNDLRQAATIVNQYRREQTNAEASV